MKQIGLRIRFGDKEFVEILRETTRSPVYLCFSCFQNGPIFMRKQFIPCSLALFGFCLISLYFKMLVCGKIFHFSCVHAVNWHVLLVFK